MILKLNIISACIFLFLWSNPDLVEGLKKSQLPTIVRGRGKKNIMQQRQGIGRMKEIGQVHVPMEEDGDNDCLENGQLAEHCHHTCLSYWLFNVTRVYMLT
jgi:hypothetical protein